MAYHSGPSLWQTSTNAHFVAVIHGITVSYLAALLPTRDHCISATFRPSSRLSCPIHPVLCLFIGSPIGPGPLHLCLRGPRISVFKLMLYFQIQMCMKVCIRKALTIRLLTYQRKEKSPFPPEGYLGHPLASPLVNICRHCGTAHIGCKF